MKKVAIVMGSDSDLPIMKECAEFLDELGIEYMIDIISAHRTPEKMFQFALEAKANGFSVIVAGAGGAAHLPGMVASLTPLPVIGVPIKSAHLSGWDSLLSIASMPPGIPVATMAVNGAKNAGILAAKILGAADPEISAMVEFYMSSLKNMIEAKANDLQNQGYKEYLKGLGL
ncbi:MAG: 5-(carboxyamino)imidazole ribonucleotide mutase [Defluviitaleaceae bacterium]|nr:5-(carboxyamino)imidazole ribonucleotide mutase [Defluviitaleaceae bacterium]